MRSVVQVPCRTTERTSSTAKFERLVIGDSMLRDLRPPLGAKVIVARGAKTSSLLDRTRDEIHHVNDRIHALVLMVGTNDVADGESLSKFESDYDSLVRKLARRGPKRLWLVNILPRPRDVKPRVRGYNAVISAIARSRGCIFVNAFKSFTDTRGLPRLQFFNQDGLHLSKSGSERLFDILASHLNDKMIHMRLA